MASDSSAFSLHNAVGMRAVALLLAVAFLSGCGPAAAAAGDLDEVGGTQQAITDAAKDGSAGQHGDKSTVVTATSASRSGGTVALPQDPIPWRATVVNGTVTIEFDMPTEVVR